MELQSTDDPTLPLNVDTKEHNTVNFQKWVYYKFTVQAHHGFVLTVEHARGANKNHDVDVYVRKGGALPDRTQYDYFDINIMNTITIDGNSELASTVWIAGIYGFTGTETPFTIMYSQTNGCPQNCNNNGMCRRDNVCSCNVGHVGTYCQYNSSSVSLNKDYTTTLSSTHWVYYSVDVFSANNLDVHVRSTGGDVDLYLHYNTIPDFINYEYAEISTNNDFTLTIVEPLLGTWHLGFFAFFDTTFTFTVSEQRTCPMNCSLHGSCVGAICHCNPSFTGLSCEEDLTPLNTSAVHGYVSQNFWNFYKFTANSENPFKVRLTQKLANSNCDLYIMSGAKPTKFIYQYTNVTLLPTTEILVSNPGMDVWWIGVYGTSDCEYDIKLESSIIQPCNCANGHCVDNVCLCNEGWFGRECDVRPTVLTNAQRSANKTLANRKWEYFEMTAQNSSLFTVVLNEASTSGLVWLYLAKGTFPTLESFESTDTSLVANHRISMEFLTPRTTRFVIGVYGSPYILNEVTYSLVAFYTPF